MIKEAPTIQPITKKEDFFYGKAKLSNHRRTILFFDNQDNNFGITFIEKIVDVFHDIKKFAVVSIYKDPFFERVGRLYEKHGYLRFYDLKGSIFAECIKKDMLELLSGSVGTIKIFKPFNAKKYIAQTFGFSGVKPL